MKKLLALTAVSVALAFAAAPSFADHHGDKGAKGHKFEKHDLNGDGTITKDEFLSGASERFGKMDANGDGSVSKEEAKALRDEMKAQRKDRKDGEKSSDKPSE